MIQFSVFLYENEKQKAKADEKIKLEKKLLVEKNEEIESKKKMLEVLANKAKESLGRWQPSKSKKNIASFIAEKKSNKDSEYAQILMSINNIEERCLTRKYNKGQKEKHQVTVQENKPRDYNNFNRRGQFAVYQLKAIYAYLNDFKSMADHLQKDTEKKGN